MTSRTPLTDADRLALDALADGEWHYAGTRTWRIYAGLAASGLVEREPDRSGQLRYRLSAAGQRRRAALRRRARGSPARSARSRPGWRDEGTRARRGAQPVAVRRLSLRTRCISAR